MSRFEGKSVDWRDGYRAGFLACWANAIGAEPELLEAQIDSLFREVGPNPQWVDLSGNPLTREQLDEMHRKWGAKYFAWPQPAEGDDAD